jgi:hypothetical protein
LLLLNITIKPGDIYNREVIGSIGEQHILDFHGKMLKITGRYELRASWPSTSPAKIIFACRNCSNAITSDEKIMFNANLESIDIRVSVVSNGVPRKGITQYPIPLNVSLEELHYGLTYHVWKLICVALPLLALFISIIIQLTKPYST